MSLGLVWKGIVSQLWRDMKVDFRVMIARNACEVSIAEAHWKGKNILHLLGSVGRYRGRDQPGAVQDLTSG